MDFIGHTFVGTSLILFTVIVLLGWLQLRHYLNASKFLLNLPQTEGRYNFHPQNTFFKKNSDGSEAEV